MCFVTIKSQSGTSPSRSFRRYSLTMSNASGIFLRSSVVLFAVAKVFIISVWASNTKRGTVHYGGKKMKIILNGRKVGKGYEAYYFENKAYFTKRGLKKRTILHELYHHLVYMERLELSERIEEKEANDYVKCFLKN
jgi:hypothetical protein